MIASVLQSHLFSCLLLVLSAFLFKIYCRVYSFVFAQANAIPAHSERKVSLDWVIRDRQNGSEMDQATQNTGIARRKGRDVLETCSGNSNPVREGNSTEAQDLAAALRSTGSTKLGDGTEASRGTTLDPPWEEWDWPESPRWRHGLLPFEAREPSHSES